MFLVQINHTGKGFLFLIFRKIKLRKYSSLHNIFYGLKNIDDEKYNELYKQEVYKDLMVLVIKLLFNKNNNTDENLNSMLNQLKIFEQKFSMYITKIVNASDIDSKNNIEGHKSKANADSKNGYKDKAINTLRRIIDSKGQLQNINVVLITL